MYWVDVVVRVYWVDVRVYWVDVVVRVYWVDVRVFDWFLGGCWGLLGGC